MQFREFCGESMLCIEPSVVIRPIKLAVFLPMGVDKIMAPSTIMTINTNATVAPMCLAIKTGYEGSYLLGRLACKRHHGCYVLGF